MPHRTVVQALAMAMLKRTTFEHDDASADTIWRAQHREGPRQLAPASPRGARRHRL